MRGAGRAAFDADLRGADAAGRVRRAPGGGEGGRDGGLRAALPRPRDRSATARAVRGLGQRGHSWGNPDWDKIALTRTVGAWFDDGTGVALATVRPVKADHHADEAHVGRGARPRARARGRRGPALDDHRRGRPPASAPGSSCGSTSDDDYPLPRHRRGAVGLDARARRAAAGRRVLPLAHRGPHRRSAATTSSGARDRGRRQRLRRRRHAAADRRRSSARTRSSASRSTRCGKAMALTRPRYGEPPLFKLERGQMTEAEFIAGARGDARREVARPPDRPRRLRRSG